MKGGEYVRFEAFYNSKDLKSPRRNAVVKLHWRDAAGNKVPQDADVLTSELPNYRAYAEAEHRRHVVGEVQRMIHRREHAEEGLSAQGGRRSWAPPSRPVSPVLDDLNENES